MKNWEQAEFEAQQEAIRKWAEKKLDKLINGWWFRRKSKKLARLASIIKGKELTTAIEFYEVVENERQKTYSIRTR